MIILDTTTRKLEVVLGGSVTANQLPFTSSYVDVSQSTFAMTGLSSNNGASNNTTPVTVVAAPGSSTSRQVKYVSIWNEDTADATVSVIYDDNGTDREIVKTTLSTGETLEYTDGKGWKALDANGAIKTELALSNVDINGGTIDGTTIGGTTADAGTFTSVTASGAVTLNQTDGVDYTPGSDTDTDIVTVNVTGTPKIFWDESQDRFSSNKGFDITSGEVLAGTTTAATDNPTLDIFNSGGRAIVITNNITDSANKIANVLGRHYTNSEENFVIVRGESFSASTGVSLGGGAGNSNAATFIRGVLAANTTTLTGTEVYRYDSSDYVSSLDHLIGGTPASDTPSATVDAVQGSTTGAQPVLEMTQADVSEEFMKLIGSAASGNLTQSIVAEADVSTATRQGFLKVNVQDDGNQITDQAYYIPIFTLA